MPIRLRITLLFTLAAFIILGIVCVAIYYFSSSSRIMAIQKRLSNRAITTERLLRQSETFDRELIRKIDSSTTMSLKNKSVQAYNGQDWKLYNYNDTPGDTLYISPGKLTDARDKGKIYFTEGDKEVIAYHDKNSTDGMVIVCAAVDVDGKNYLHELRSILAIGFIGGVLISLGGGYFFSGGLLKPVKKITHEVTDISAYNLSRRIQTGKSKDEWHELSTTLNELLDRLKESFDLQRRFVSNASHELSTPLTLISSQLEIALQRTRTDEEYRNVLTTVLRDVHYMNNLVQTLLKFATASGDAGGLNIDLVRIDEVLMRLPAEIQRQERDHTVSLHFNGLPEDERQLLVFGNEELLFTAIKNIVANACKYSPDHHADVILSLPEKGFNIQVKDKGMGIGQEELENIFQPFYRIQESRSVQGFGLGLSLANRIIKFHKGKITVVSQKEEGTVFTIELPAADPH